MRPRIHSSFNAQFKNICAFRTGAFCWAVVFVVLAILTVGVYVVLAANGTWIGNSISTQNWSDPTKWSGGTIADAAGSTADFSTIDITAGRNVTVDGAVASRTVGTLLVGDTGGSSESAYTFAATGSGTLTFNNSGSGAVLTQTTNTGSNTFNSTLPIILGDDLTINNNAATASTARSLTILGGITGAHNLTLNAGGSNANTITFDTTNINNGGTITNSGTGSGTVTISGGIGPSVIGLAQSSSTSPLTISTSDVTLGTDMMLTATGTKLTTISANITGAHVFTIGGNGSGVTTLSGNNTFSNGLTFSSGTLNINNSGTSSTNSAVGIGTFTINGGTIDNTSVVDVTLATNNAQTWGGDFTVGVGSGTKNLNLGTGAVVLTANRQINVSGLTSNVTIGGSIGDGGNGYSLTKAGPGTGTMILTGASTYTGTTTVSAGTLKLNRSGGGTIAATNNVVISGGTLEISSDQTISGLTMSSGTLLIDSGVTLTITGIYNVTGGAINNLGTLKLNNSSANFPGSGAIVTNMNSLEVASGTVTLTSNLIVSGSSGTLTVSGGTFNQGASFDLTAGTINVSTSSATLKNTGTGDLFIGAGGVANAGTISYDGSGAGCGGADAIVINSSDNSTQRSWTGTGSFSMTDVNVAHQGGTSIILVRSGTDGGSNGANWVFVPACAGAGATYTWTPTIGTDYQVAANWNPTRTTPAATDTLIFDGSITPLPTVTDVANETIASLQVTNGAFVTMDNTSAPATAATLTISGGGTDDLSIGSGNRLTLTGNTNALTIFVTSNSTGLITGAMAVSGTAAHQLLAAGGASSVTFSGSGATFTTDPTYSLGTNPFGAGTGSNNGSIIFASGSVYFHNNGGSPFGSAGNNVVTFQTSSEADFLTATGFEASGRTYANLVIGNSSTQVIINQSGSGNFQVDNLVINSTNTSQSTLQYNGSGASTITLQGNIQSAGTAGGTAPDLLLTAGSGGIQIKVPGGGGTVTYGVGGAAHSIMFSSDATVDSATTVNLARIVQMGAGNDKTMTVNGTLVPNAMSSPGYIIGNVKKSFATTGSKTFEVGTVNGYTPVDVNATAGTGTLTATVTQGTRPTLDANHSLKRYWTITENVDGLTADLTFHYLNGDVFGTESSYQVIVVDSGVATRFPNSCPTGNSCVDFANNTFTKKSVSSFSDWTAGEPLAPTAVNLRSFDALRSGDDVFIEWRSGFEVHNLGYNLYREQNGVRTLLTPSLIAGSALIASRDAAFTAGGAYSWTDRVSGDATYWLEDVDLNGTATLHGPIVPIAQDAGKAGTASAAERSQTMGEVADNRTSVLFNSWPAQAIGGQRSEASRKGEGVASLVTSVANNPALATQQIIAATPGVKIKVSRNGWYRITQPELIAAGLASANASNLQLFENASQVPIKVSGDGSTFGPSDYIEFYGHGIESVTDTAQTYYLIAGTGPSQRMATPVSSALQPPSGPSSFDLTVERKERGIYFSGLLNGDAENIFGRVVSSSGVPQSVPATDLDKAVGAAARLEVQLQGVNQGAHSVQVKFNGTDIGTVGFANADHTIQTLDVPAALLLEGDNTVRLTALGGSSDVSLIDKLRLTYAHTFTAENDSLFAGITSAGTSRVSGFTTANIRAIDLSDGANPRELATVATKQADASYSVDFQVAGGSTSEPHRVLVFADGAMAHPDLIAHNDPSTWNAKTNAADYLVITTRDLLRAIQPLLNLRRQNGFNTQVVDIEDLYDEYSFGLHSPYAIHDFLQTAIGDWRTQPKYVLFVGDSSYDPKNYFGRGFNDLVPSKLIDTTQMETASDDWFVDFNQDGIADVSVGRLPARTPADAASMVNKIVNFETSRASGNNAAVLVNDRTFEGEATTLQGVLPSTLAVQNISRSTSDDATIHSQILTALNKGPRFVNYFGHGSNGVWTSAPLLSVTDAPSLTNANASVFTMMTCFNGYFVDVFGDSLSEALLKSPGGAVSAWGSSSLTEPSGQSVIADEFYRQILSPQGSTLGDAVRIAKLATGDMDVRRTWILFGDPAMATAGQLAPTEAKATISGVITDNNGHALSGVSVALTGKQSRETITDVYGNYSFADADTNGFYNVTASRANYSFNPGSRSFTLNGIHTSESFIGTANGTGLNPLDTDGFFVRQHYLDFLNREPDESGFNFWTNEIASCGSDDRCREVKRINTSAAYFLSIEFQETGFEVYRLYKAAYDNLPNAPVPVRFAEFTSDTHDIAKGVIVGNPNWQATLEANKAAFAQEFVQRARFATQYPTSMPPADFVDALFAHTGIAPSADERSAAINEFGGATDSTDAAARARALRRVAENSRLAQQEFNRAFVLMEYFGYLRRDPNSGADTDFSGYNFWLSKLNGFQGNYINAEMVKAFLASSEYRRRFGN